LIFQIWTNKNNFKIKKKVNIYFLEGFDYIFRDPKKYPYNHFFTAQKIDHLNNDDSHLFSQAYNFKNEHFLGTDKVWSSLYLSCYNNFRDKVTISFKTLLNMVYVSLYVVFKEPLFSYFIRDFIEYPIIKKLNDDDLINGIFITNSHLIEQSCVYNKLPDKKFSFVMLWYSSNNAMIQFSDHHAIAEYPFYRYYVVDHSYVWNEFHKDWLLKNTQTKSSTLSQVLYFDKEFKENTSSIFTITVFDVPTQNEMLRNTDSIFAYSDFFRKENVYKFITDIVELKSRVPDIRIIVKIKKIIKTTENNEYMNFLRAYEEKGLIEIIDTKDLVSVMSQSHMAISYPYSSPSVYAANKSKPALYYDPTGTIDFHNYKSKFITTISNKKDLYEYVKRQQNEFLEKHI
jgi:polysaccharide biosynthesis PFTS motif protein